MTDKKIFDKFFHENQAKGGMPTAPAIAHFHIALDSNPDAADKMQELFNEEIFKAQPGRKEKMLAERREIEAVVSCEQVVKIMRRHTDPMNQHILINKALAFEDEIVPEIIKRLKTSLNDGFIETSVRILAKSNKNIAAELIACFDDIRNPYAQSMVLIVLGFKANEEWIPWLMTKYQELKKLYPDESYYDGAYYAIFEMENRFCPAKKR